MPYIEVEELPEGVSAADVVPREDYEAVVGERDATATQRDEALTMLENARKEVRDTKARYADAILTAGTKAQTSTEEGKAETRPAKYALSSNQLFGRE